MSVVGSFRAAVGSAADFLYPPVCPLCYRPHKSDSAEPAACDRFCEPCRDDLQPKESGTCRRCAAPVGPHLGMQEHCRHCRGDRFAFERVVKLGVYEGRFKSAIRRIKRPDGADLAVALADWLCESAQEQVSEFAADAVAFIPRHWSRRLWRPHNSAEILARRLARRFRLPLLDGALRKTRRTPRQASLTPAQRRTNLRRAFSAELPKSKYGGTILLADDVLTTGTTAHQAARALRSAGATQVFVAVLARGIGR